MAFSMNYCFLLLEFIRVCLRFTPDFSGLAGMLVVRMLTRIDLENVQLLLALVRGSRPENTTVDRHIALNDAHQLNKVFTGKVGKEDTLIRIFCTRSQQQLTATLNYYHQHYGQEFEQVRYSFLAFFLFR